MLCVGQLDQRLEQTTVPSIFPPCLGGLEGDQFHFLAFFHEDPVGHLPVRLSPVKATYQGLELPTQVFGDVLARNRFADGARGRRAVGRRRWQR